MSTTTTHYVRSLTELVPTATCPQEGKLLTVMAARCEELAAKRSYDLKLIFAASPAVPLPGGLDGFLIVVATPKVEEVMRGLDMSPTERAAIDEALGRSVDGIVVVTSWQDVLAVRDVRVIRPIGSS